MTFRAVLTPILIYAFAILGGWGMSRIGAPLPWMIGPLIVTAAIYIVGLSTYVIPVRTRPVGQITVAAQVGLSFSPVALAQLVELSPLLVGLAMATVLCAGIATWTLSRAAGIRLVPALLSTIPTSPVEAAVIAERLGWPIAPVIFAQTLRIASVVVLVPVAIYAIDGWPDRSASIGGGSDGSYWWLLLLAGATAGAWTFRLMRVSNPWFLGALATSAVLTAAGTPPAPLPAVVISAAQVLLGTWLGSTFRRDLFASSGRLIGAIVGSTLLFLGLTSLVAVVVASAIGMHWQNLVLGTAPGGLTEMALTAKFMGLDVALITACHLVRIFMIVPMIPFLARALHRIEERRHRTHPPLPENDKDS